MMLFDEEVYILSYEKSMDKKLIYAPIRGFVALIEQQDAEIIEKGSSSSLADLEQNNCLKKWRQVLKKIPPKDLDIMQKGFPILNIDFSNGCHMRCIYCYAGRGEGSVKYQKKENINLIINTYFNYLQQQANFQKDAVCPITFSNDAEPTFVPELLIYAVNRIKEKAKEYALKPIFSIPTNGAFDSHMRNFIIENFENISFSFEGLEDIQNKHRPFSNGSPSYNCVYSNAKAVYKSGLKMGFNIVVTTHNLEYLKETVAYFQQHFPGSSISFSPVNPAERIVKEQAGLEVDCEVFQRKLIEATAYARQTTIKIGDKNMQNYHIPRRHYCSSTAKPNWNVNLRGEIYACMESKDKTMKIGEINFKTQELKLRSKCIQSLRAYTVDQMDKCSDCLAKYVCVGGCKAKAEMQTHECDNIRLKCLYLINQAYEEEQLFKKGQALFRRTSMM